MAPMVAKRPPLPPDSTPSPDGASPRVAGTSSGPSEPVRRSWSTAVTIVTFLCGGAALGLAPVPDWARPIDLSSLDAANSVFERVTKKPKMTLASMEETDTQREEALLNEVAGDLVADGTGTKPTSDTAEPDETLTFINIDDDVTKPSSENEDPRVRVSPPPSKKTKILRRIAKKLKANGTKVENPCTSHLPSGCQRTALDPFFAALDAVAQKVPGSQATIVTLGNSLIASDHVTDRVRSRLVAEFGDGGRGYLLPDRLSKLAGRRVRTGRGTSGWEIRTFAQKKPGRRGFGFAGSMHESSRRKDKVNWRLRGATVAKLFWLDHERSPGFHVEVDGKVLHRQPKTNSKAKESGEFFDFADGGHGRDRTLDLEIPPGAKNISVVARGSGVVLYGIALERETSGVTFDTIGVPASDAAMYMGVDEGVFARQLKARDPSLVILMIGGNETRSLSFGWVSPEDVKRNYAALVDRTQKAVPGAACLAVAPIDAAKATAAGASLVTRPEVLDVVAIEREVALEKGCGFLNFHEAMGGVGALQRFHREGLVNADLVHPTGKGGDVLGTLVADAILNSYRDTPAPKEKLEVKTRLVRPRLYGLSTPGFSAESGQRTPSFRTSASQAPLSRFFSKLTALEASGSDGGRVAIGQFGASHTAAQYFTDHMRTRFQQRYGEAGRGLVPAGRRAPEYLAGRVTRKVVGSAVVEDGRSVVLGGTMNPAGSALRLEPGSRFDVGFCDGCKKRPTSERGTLDVTWLHAPNMGTADVFVNNVRVGSIGPVPSFSPMNARSGFGVEASTSDVRRLRIPVRGERHTVSIQVRKKGDRGRAGSKTESRRESSEGPIIVFGVAHEISRSGVIVDAMGLPGSTGMTMQRWRQDIVADQVRHRAYDLVILAWGTNEASLSKLDEVTYRHHLTKTAETLLSASPGADCLFFGATESYKRVKSKGKTELVAAPSAALVDRVQRSVAAEFGCAFFDPKRAMGGTGAMKKWVAKGLAKPDYIHLSRDGYRKLADAFVHDLTAQNQYAQAKSAADEKARVKLAAATDDTIDQPDGDNDDDAHENSKDDGAVPPTGMKRGVDPSDKTRSGGQN